MKSDFKRGGCCIGFAVGFILTAFGVWLLAFLNVLH